MAPSDVKFCSHRVRPHHRASDRAQATHFANHSVAREWSADSLTGAADRSTRLELRPDGAYERLAQAHNPTLSIAHHLP